MRAVTCLALLGAISAPAGALTPPPPCEGEESGMSTYKVLPLGENSGVVVENYYETGAGTAPIPELVMFYGIRLTHCATGQMVVFRADHDAYQAVAALGATEFLRAKVQGARKVTANEMKRAARAVYGTVQNLTEDEETCGCNFYFPDVRPKGMTPWPERGN